MNKKIYWTFIALLSLSLLAYGFFGKRTAIEKIIRERNNNNEPTYSRLIIDKISEGKIILSSTDEKKVHDVLFYIGRHVVAPTDEEITIDSDTYTLNFYGDKIEEGMTVTIDSKGYVEIYTIKENKAELKNYKIIENTINIENIKKLCL